MDLQKVGAPRRRRTPVVADVPVAERATKATQIGQCQRSIAHELKLTESCRRESKMIDSARG